jgi:hypothetical protein
MARKITLIQASFLLFFTTICLSVSAQPSGGPYGPVRHNYKVPENQGTIFYVSPEGKAEYPGKIIDEPTTIEAAIERAVTGDVIILRGGTFRTGDLVINQGITLQAYSNEKPVLKGTFEATDWKDNGNGLWTTHWERFFPSKPDDWWNRKHSGKTTPLYRFNNDMVFIDGKFLQTAGWEGEVTKDSYFIDYETGTVYIGQDPSGHLVEITAFKIGLLRTTGECHGKSSDGIGPVIRGITFTQYAYRALEIEGKNPEGLSDEKDHGKDVTGTTLENCTISFCSRVAAYLRGDKLTVRNCRISDTSTEGLYILSSSDVLLEKNIFTRNNIENIDGYFPAAVKIFNQCYRVTCNDNLVTDLPNSNGVWYDVGNVDGVFTNNWVENVGYTDFDINTNMLWPSQNGFFFEISKGAICTGNVFVNCDHGVMVLNASNVKIFQNTFVNSMLCVGRDQRSAQGDHFGWHPSTGPDVDERVGHLIMNNLLSRDNSINRPLLFVWQPAALCEKLPQPMLDKMDNNAYVSPAGMENVPLILWSPSDNKKCQQTFNSPVALHEDLKIFEGGSVFFNSESVAVFRSPELKNFELLPLFPAKGIASKLPVDLVQKSGISKKQFYLGAYPQENMK